MAYTAQQQFLFPLVEVDPIFWVLAGLLVAATSRGEATIRLPRSPLVAGAFAVLALAAATFGALELVADRRAANSYSLLASGNHAEAVDAADEAAAMRPDSIRYWFIASDVGSRPGDSDALGEGLVRIDRALAISPRDPILMATRARLLLDLAQATNRVEDIDRATSSLSELTLLDPHNAGLRLLKGVALVQAGDLDAAEGEWRLAQSLAPNSAIPAMNLARLYLSQDRIEKARASYFQALSIDPLAPGLPELGRLLDGDETEAPVP
jgi:Flp pilus assembly protein TadD